MCMAWYHCGVCAFYVTDNAHCTIQNGDFVSFCALLCENHLWSLNVSCENSINITNYMLFCGCNEQRSYCANASQCTN